MKRAKENNEDTANRHAAQIFAEMLSQVCHSEFYDRLDNEFQEVQSNLSCVTQSRPLSFTFDMRKLRYSTPNCQICIYLEFLNLAQSMRPCFLIPKSDYTNPSHTS
jgi:predicted nucleic-acid-binding Zn-ribbon protein